MRRTVIAGCIALALTATQSGAHSQSSGPRTTAAAHDGNTKVVVSNPGGEEPGQPAAPARRGRARARPGQLVTLYSTRWQPDDAEPCLHAVTIRREAPLSAEEAFAND
ncbi:MAG TPA: hypothetical protein VGV93_07700, partial [Acidimicrobiales bacterium]|nr:hypothetical protein [Acidimicrobiales bacterium]